MILIVAAWLVLVTAAMGGLSQNHVSVWFENWVAWDNNMGAIEPHHDPCGAHGGWASTAGNESVCYIAPGQTIEFHQFGVTALDTLTDVTDESCKFMIETHTSITDNILNNGTPITSSAINTAETDANAAGTCVNNPVEFTLDTAGESCLRKIDRSDAAATISGPGWWRVIAVDTDNAVTPCDETYVVFWAQGVVY